MIWTFIHGHSYSYIYIYIFRYTVYYIYISYIYICIYTVDKRIWYHLKTAAIPSQCTIVTQIEEHYSRGCCIWHCYNHWQESTGLPDSANNAAASKRYTCSLASDLNSTLLGVIDGHDKGLYLAICVYNNTLAHVMYVPYYGHTTGFIQKKKNWYVVINHKLRRLHLLGLGLPMTICSHFKMIQFSPGHPQTICSRLYQAHSPEALAPSISLEPLATKRAQQAATRGPKTGKKWNLGKTQSAFSCLEPNQRCPKILKAQAWLRCNQHLCLLELHDLDVEKPCLSRYLGTRIIFDTSCHCVSLLGCCSTSEKGQWSVVQDIFVVQNVFAAEQPWFPKTAIESNWSFCSIGWNPEFVQCLIAAASDLERNCQCDLPEWNHSWVQTFGYHWWYHTLLTIQSRSP